MNIQTVITISATKRLLHTSIRAAWARKQTSKRSSHSPHSKGQHSEVALAHSPPAEMCRCCMPAYTPRLRRLFSSLPQQCTLRRPQQKPPYLNNHSEGHIYEAGFFYLRGYPFRSAVPFRGQTTRIVSSLSPKRDCGPKKEFTHAVHGSGGGVGGGPPTYCCFSGLLGEKSLLLLWTKIEGTLGLGVDV